MIIDTSAIIAVARVEQDAPEVLAAMIAADRRAMSAGSYLELETVLTRFADRRIAEAVEQLLVDLDVEIVAFDVSQAEIARSAYREFGKGNHPARLNFGDCFSYALARERAEPLLYKGQDFRRTDILSAISEVEQL